MRALVVYESMFGNTRRIARAIGDGLSLGGMEVEVVEVGVAPAVPDPTVDVLVVGAPTHAFGLSHANTRASAAEQAFGDVVSSGIGMRDWLDALPDDTGVGVAFDTHIDKRVPGSAARAAHKRLRRRGRRTPIRPESFFVSDTGGPLVDGELDRAGLWGQRVASVVAGADRAHDPA